MKQFYLICCLLIISIVTYAQDKSMESDTIALQEDILPLELDSLCQPSHSEFFTDYPDIFSLDKEFLLSEEPETDLLSVPKWDFTIIPQWNYYETDYLTVTPFHYSFNNWYEGGDMVGVNNRFQFNSKFRIDLGISATSSFISEYQPNRYNNTSLFLSASYQIHDRVRLVGYGQISLREGIDPMLNPTINGGNYYGGEVHFRVYKNFEIGFGIKNNYYKGNWTTHRYFTPGFNN